MMRHAVEADSNADPVPNSHVHLTVKAARFDGTRINPRNPDLWRRRKGFAQALPEGGRKVALSEHLMIRCLRYRKTMGDQVAQQKRATPQVEGQAAGIKNKAETK